jgi:photosystem II stability/assembly factor-like uncharacterized protein
MKLSLILTVLLAVVFLTSSATAQLSLLETTRQPLQDVTKEQAQYFAERGTGRGSGYRQYTRWQQWVMPRAYPSGQLLNDTALTWFNFYTMQRSPDYMAARAAADAAGIGTGNWHAVVPKDPQREGGDVGRINAIAFDPTDPKTMYAGSPGGGLWRTKDGGDSWHILTEQLPMLTVSDVAVDPRHPDTIYILTGDGEMYVGASMGILKSINGGKDWINTGLVWTVDQRVYGHRLAIDPANPDIMLVATSVGLFRTQTGADGVWSKVLPQQEHKPDGGGARGADRGPNAFVDVLFHPTNPSIVYAATRSEVYRSTDAGQTWARLSKGLPHVTADTAGQRNDLPPEVAADRIRLAVTPKSPDTLYVLYGSPMGFWIGLYRSDDAGETFVKRSSSAPPPSTDARVPAILDLKTPNILYEANTFHSQTDYDLAMAVSPSNADQVVVGGLDVWRSDDGGKTWRQKSYWRNRGPHYTHADVHMLAFNGDTLFVTSDGGVYRSNNSADSWASIGNFKGGMQIAQPYAVCISEKKPDLFFYGAQDNGSWKLDTQGRLKQVLGGDGFVCQIDPDDPEVVYASLYFGQIYKSTDGGNSFQQLKTPAYGPWLTPYVLGPHPSDVYVCERDLWLGAGRGFEWKNLTNGRIGSSVDCRQVAVATTDPKTIYVAKGEHWGMSWVAPAAAARPAFFGGNGVFRTTDGGTTWQNITGTLPVGNAALTGLAVSPTDPRRVWVTFSGYKADAKVFGSTDGGTTWIDLSEGLPNLPVNAVSPRTGATNGIFVGLDVGVFYRDDVLGRWTPFFDNLPYSSVQSLIVDEKNRRIVAALFGRGIWQSPLPEPCETNCGRPSPSPRAAEAFQAPGEQQAGAYRGAVDIFEPARATR